MNARSIRLLLAVLAFTLPAALASAAGTTPAQLKTGLAKAATDAGKVGQDAYSGRGYVDALRAVTQ